MSPSAPARPFVRALSITAIAVLLVSISLAWASRQQAGSSWSKSARHHSSSAVFADKGGIKPEAATITVNSLSDVANGTDGLCTLREALAAANNDTASGGAAGECAAGTSGGSDAIDMTGVTGTINLTGTLPNISSSMTITGPGAGQLTVSGSNAVRVFSVDTGTTVTMSGLTIANGQATGNAAGGGVANNGTLTLRDALVTGNTTNGQGGGIVTNSSLLLINTTVTNNTATEGAGIAVTSGTATVNNSQVTGNHAGGFGGGIYNRTGTLIVNGTSVNSNTAHTGGGIFNTNSPATFTLTNSLVNGNSARFVGGGMHSALVPTTLVNSTISNNSGDGPEGGGGIGSNDRLTLVNCTITGNTHTHDGGGIYWVGLVANGTPQIRNTIIANNTSGGTGPDLKGTFTSNDYNLFKNTSGATINGTTTHDITNQDPLLGSLGSNGGPTQTFPLLAGSPALNAGNDCVTDANHCLDANISQITTDQRGTGFNRRAGVAVDIGAYEMQTPLASLAATATNEDTQLVVTFDAGDATGISSVSSSNSSLVPNDSAHLSAALTGTTGVVTINPATNASGTTNISITVTRPGGPDSNAFLLTVNAVNDTPSFTKGADQAVFEDAGAQTVNNWATSISVGPADEGGQTVNFNITGNTNATLFSSAPAVNSSGTLTYTPAANANGSATITLTAQDNGGTANGGVDTSPSQSFTITVNPVADTPSVTNATTTVNSQTTSGLVISRNGADGSEVSHFKITSIQNGTLFKNNGTTQINNNDFITFAEGNAGLKFTPGANLSSPSTSFSFQVQASLSNSDAGLGGATATATITVNCGATVVTNSNDSGAGSLRATINSACVGSTITFDMSAGHVSSPITLTSGELVIDKALTIQGPGANLLSISGNNSSRVFRVTAATAANVNFSGLTLMNGRAASDVGGAIYVFSSANTRISFCVITNNTAILGGGIAMSSGTFTVEYSTISNNSAGTGGGIYGGLGVLNVVNSTVSANSATTNNGGGIIQSSGSGEIINSTISHNTAASSGGGMFNNCLCASFQFRNTIVGLNNANTGRDLGGSFISQGHNLIGSSSGNGGFINGVNGDLVDVNPRLATLANNGGRTPTVALLAGSPALDAGDNCVTDAAHCGDANLFQLVNDQRGTPFNRSVDAAIDADTTAAVDIGAFEAQVSVEDITDKTINEDSQITFQFNTTLSAQTVTASSSNGGMVPSSPPNLSLSGSGSQRTLTIVPVADAFGTTTITITTIDSNAQTMSDTFVLTVNGVNDAPSFTKGPDQTVNEDSVGRVISGWATNASPGPNESGQTLTFTATNDNNALFSAQPAISSTGTLTYTPAANANGTATVTVTLKDNGGTANGGADTSAPQTFTITVNPVNDAPSFTKGANQTVNEDAGAQTVNNWATAISAGPANEAGQTLTFQITGNTNAALFSTGPAVSSTGALTYTPAADANGSATITINLKDDGGTTNGGVDTSASQTFTITVNSVNDAPSFTKGADQTVNNNAGAQTVTNWATSISAGPSNESGQTLTFQVTGNTNTALFTAGPSVNSSGTLSYTPSSSAGGTATITINLKDNGGTANGGADTSASQTFTITVTPVGGFVSFASSTAGTTENSGSTTVNVVRTGDTSKAVNVNYATNADGGVPCSTANGVASPKCDFTAALGTLSFAANETSKPITILISQDSFVEGPETITLTLSSPTGNAALGTPSSMSVTIADDTSEPPANIIDDANMFVRMHYHDFLNRDGDQSGIDFWTGQMTNCGSPDLTVCRVNVSGAFFLSIEFQQTGYLVERIYKTGYGDATGTSTIGGSHQIFVPVVRFNEFLADTQRIGRGVVVGATGWEQALENNKQAYALEFVQTSRFITAFPTSMTPAAFVDKLNTNAGGVLSVSERQTVINLFGNSVNTTNVTARAQALRQVAEDQDLFNAESNRAFVLSEYFGYLRRNPNDAPEPTLDYTGYDFWLQKLNQFNGNYINAEMVKAFISADEYRGRFGP